MSQLQDIPITIHHAGLNGDSNMVDAVIKELGQLMAVYLHSGKKAAIDIRSLPLSVTDYADLRQRLGKGEVSAHASLSGDTDVYETALSGVWWVTHKNTDNRVLAELLEVGCIPDVLCAHEDDMKTSLEALQQKTQDS